MMVERLLELLIKKEQGIINMAEQAELAKLLNQDPGAEEAQNLVADFFNTSANFDDSVQQQEMEQSVITLNARMSTLDTPNAPIKKLGWWKKMAVAASVLFLLGVGFKSIFQQKSINLQQTVVNTDRTKSNITLPDGSTVWVNAHTKLTYDKSFGEGARELTLEGEAFFDVVKDKDRPFIVHTKTIDIKVIGTAFNVRAYSNETTTQATLVRGVVEVVMKQKNNDRITLKPSEKIIVQNKHEVQSNGQASAPVHLPELVLSTLTPNPIDSGFLETQWIKPNIAFDQQKLEDIVPLLENWYQIKISVANSELLQRRFSGKIEKESIAEVLESFKLASGLKYKIENQEITIYK